MNVGIDARMLGPSVGGGGLGRYVEELVDELASQSHKHRYVLFVKNETQAKRLEHRIADIHWYTLAEQIKMPALIDHEDLDLIHYPHWNVPLRAKTPFVVTIHDLILLEQPRSARATTRGPLVYWAKYQLFRRVLRHAVTASRAIIAPSQYTKDSILKFFPETDPKKIHVVHEGLTQLPSRPSTLNPSSTPYLLYVGNAYPHKNLNRLQAAFNLVRESHPDLELLFAGRSDQFYKKLQAQHTPGTRYVLDPTDTQLAELYADAHGYVFPSLSEGFGLPPLEAMSFSVPVAASKASCMPEILENAAIYFDPESVDDMAKTIAKLVDDNELRTHLIARGKTQIKKYSWATMAKEIQTIYENCAG